MKTLKRIFGYTMALAVGFGVASCADENDWDVDGSHGRLFGVANDGLNVTEGDTWAEVEFSGFRGPEYYIPEYYIIEVSTDSLTDDIGMGESAGSIVFGEDRSITTSPDTIRGLLGETKYYLRMKAMSTQQTESRWVYFDNGDGGTSFETLAEQIFNTPAAADQGDTYMRMTWTPGAEVTRLTVATPDGAIVQDIDLTQLPDAVANGEYMVEGLTQLTTYVFTIYNGDTRRGELILTTMASMPDAEYKYTLSSAVTVFSQDLMDEIEAQALAQPGVDPANYSVTIGIPAGVTLDFHGTDVDTGDPTAVKIPDGMSVTFFGLAGGEAPVLNMTKSVDIGGTHAYIRFNNVQFIDTGCQYLINQSGAATISELTFESCTVSDFERCFVRLQNAGNAKSISNLNVNNCVVTNVAQGYSMFLWKDNEGVVSNLNVTNSTFDTFTRSFAEITGNDTGTAVTVNDCTFYGGPDSGRYIVDANNTTGATVNLTRCIFANSECKGVRGATPVITEVYFTIDFSLTGNSFDPTATLDGSADVFADPANHDFTLEVRGVQAGDPRWY